MDPSGSLLGGGVPGRQGPVYPHSVPALRERPLRARLPGLRHLPQRPGAQRTGIQQVHRDPVLPEQLPVSCAVLQLLAARVAGVSAQPVEPGRYGEAQGDHGKVYLLCATYTKG